MSTSNKNPKELFGGEWVAWGSGRVPVGINASDTRFNTIEQTGGAYTAALGIDHMPAHNHGSVSLTGSAAPLAWKSAGAGSGILSLGACYRDRNANKVTAGSGGFGSAALSVNATHTHTTQGKGSAFSIIQPYITCYMWKRTA